MKIFISWSGERSKHVATSLRNWLPNVVQAAKPWMSENDIESGQKWQAEISNQLNDAAYGIICVTPENQGKPWLNFEAGALSKTVGSETFVCPFLYDISKEQLVGPLTQFQVREIDKDGTKQLIFNINKRLSESLGQAQIEEAFEHWWDKFKGLIAKCPSINTPKVTRSQEEILNEILENTRALRRNVFSPLGAYLSPNTGGFGLSVGDVGGVPNDGTKLDISSLLPRPLPGQAGAVTTSGLLRALFNDTSEGTKDGG